MKIRSGFVSNSSSSSFVFVGFPKSSINSSTVDDKTEVVEKLGTRVINKFALDYFSSDDEYKEFLKGVVPDKFWQDIRERYSGEFGDYDAPDGYTAHTIYETGDYEVYWGIAVASVHDSGTTEFSPDEITKAQKKIKKDFPKATSKVLLVTTC